MAPEPKNNALKARRDQNKGSAENSVASESGGVLAVHRRTAYASVIDWHMPSEMVQSVGHRRTLRNGD